MKEIKKSEQVAKEITNPEITFKGYTLEEIRYQRALVTLHKEFCRTKIERLAHNVRNTNPLAPNKKSSLPGKIGFVAGKLLGGLNYLDYAMMGFSLFGSVRKIISLFKK